MHTDRVPFNEANKLKYSLPKIGYLLIMQFVVDVFVSNVSSIVTSSENIECVTETRSDNDAAPVSDTVQ